MNEPLLEFDDLTIEYETRNGAITAVSDASFAIHRGEYFGLAGESGCGKSTAAKSLLNILDDNGQISSGAIRYKGEELQNKSEKYMTEHIYWNEVSYIPQSSMDSLDPLKKISRQAVEIAQTHTDMTKQESLEKFKEMFEIVGIQENRIDDYPHEFSGGMQQRAIIALALFLEPSLIVADEPTTALDVIMQDQIFKYLDRIKETTDVSMILITHDISVIFESCDSLAIMHSGQIAETASCRDLFDTPRHPYSILLQQAFPDVDHPDRELQTIDGYPPQLGEDVDFCTFADRCPWAVSECRDAAPPLERIEDSETGRDHYAACIRTEEVRRSYEGDATPAEVDNDI